MVQIHPDPPPELGAIAQLGERLPCTQEVGGSIPPGSTISGGLAWLKMFFNNTKSVQERLGDIAFAMFLGRVSVKG